MDALRTGPTLAMIALPTLLLLLALALALGVLSGTLRDPPMMLLGHAGGWQTQARSEGFSQPASASPYASSSSVAGWTPLADGDDPSPLLVLALQRVAAKKSGDSPSSPPVHSARADGKGVRVLAAWAETLPPGQSATAPARWYRWNVVACFYGRVDPYGSCDTLDVRVRAEWASGAPPTEWPLEVVVVPPPAAAGGGTPYVTPVPTGDLL